MDVNKYQMTLKFDTDPAVAYVKAMQNHFEREERMPTDEEMEKIARQTASCVRVSLVCGPDLEGSL